MDFTPFNTAIKQYLDKRAQEDSTFATTYAKPNKSIDECCKYIMQEVEKSRKSERCVAVSDEEVFGLAVHYYDEDDIKVDGPKSTVKVAHSAPDKEEKAPTTESTEAPEQKRKTRKPRKPKAEVDPNIPEPFDIPIF